MSNPSTPSATAGVLEVLLKGKPVLGDLGRATSGGLQALPVDSFEPNPWHDRSPDEEWTDELADSIALKGQLEAITFRTTAEGKRQIIGGHTRWDAIKLLRSRATTDEERQRYSTILANEKLNVSDDQMAEWGVIDNLMRKDPSPVDTARVVCAYRDRANLTVAQVAERFGLPLDRVKRLVNLHSAPQVIKDGITKGVMVQLYDDAGAPLMTEARPDKPARPKREHRHLDLMAAVELATLHAFLTKNTPKRADKAVLDLVTKALEEGWSFKRVQEAARKEKDRILNPKKADASSEATTNEAGEGTSAPASTTPPPFKTDERQLIVYRSRLDTASDGQRAELKELLESLLKQLSAPLTKSG